MAELDLRKYTSRAVELETAIYTQRKLMEVHESLLQEQRPLPPVKQQILEPVKPQKPELRSPPSIGGAIFAIVCIVITGCCVMLFSKVIGLLVLALGVVGIYVTKEERGTVEKHNNQKTEDYNNQCAKYAQQKEKYEQDIVTVEEMYVAACAQYEVESSEHDANSSLIMSQHHNTLTALQKALNDFYNEDIIYPKYRNFVAITTINEYLISGRCSELIGSGGAYNLYEMELCQNIIISQLSNIVSNLEQIRNNQFALYQEINKANETVGDILREIQQINTNTKLTAYFAGVTALIEATPKTYITKGYIH